MHFVGEEWVVVGEDSNYGLSVLVEETEAEEHNSAVVKLYGLVSCTPMWCRKNIYHHCLLEELQKCQRLLSLGSSKLEAHEDNNQTLCRYPTSPKTRAYPFSLLIV